MLESDSLYLWVRGDTIKGKMEIFGPKLQRREGGERWGGVSHLYFDFFPAGC